jgi:hypothetical protein
MTDRKINDWNNDLLFDPAGTLRQNQMIHRPTSHPHHHPRVPHANPEENGRELYPPSRMRPPSLSLVNHPRLFSDEFIGQGSNRLHPDTLHRQSEFVHQDSRRFHVNNIPRMMQPSPRYQELSYPEAILPSSPTFAHSQHGYQRNNEHSFAAPAALKSDDRPRSLLLYAEGKEYYHGSNSNSTGPDMIHQAPAHFHHDNRRLNVGDGAHTTLLRQSNSNHPPDISHQFNRGYQLDNSFIMFAATRNMIQDRPPSQIAQRHNSLPGLRYGSMNRPAHNPESEYYHQDRKSIKTDEVRRSVERHSSNQTARPAHPPMVRKSRNSSNDNRPCLRNKLPGVTSIARLSSSSQGGARLGSTQYLNVRHCNTVDELVLLAYSHLDHISTRGKSAFWAALPKFLQQDGKSRVQLNEQLDAILDSTMESIGHFSGQDLATTTLGLAKVMKQVESCGQRAATGSLHHSLHNLLIGGENSEKKQCILNNVAKASILILSKFDARHLSNLIYSFGLAECTPKVEDRHTILDAFADEAMSKLQHFNSQDLSNMLWSYAKLGSSNLVLFKSAGDLIVGKNDLIEFKPQELSNIVWSYSTAGEAHKRLFSKVADHIVTMKDLKHFNSQDLSNMLWAYATAVQPHLMLFSKLGDHIVTMKDFSAFMPQALSNIVWSYATAGEAHSQLYKELANHIVAMKDLRSFLPQHFSNILWSYATAGQSHSKLFSKLGDHIVAMKDLGQFKPQELSIIVWSYATMGQMHPQLFSKLGNHIVAMKDLSAFKPQELSNIVWSYATAGQSHPLLFQKVALMAILRCINFNSQELSNLLCAYATVAIIDQHLFTSFAPAVKSVLIQCNSQEVTNVAWAYAVANVNDPELFNTDFITALQTKANDFGTEECSQLHQWQLWQDEIKSGINLPPALREKCRQAFVSESYQSSRFQDDVIYVLSSIGVRPEKEVLTLSGYRIDALVEVNGKKVGIEVDGTSHFINREPTGSTLLKRRQVSNLDGICIISVPYWEWQKLGNDRVKKQQYLRSKLGLV